MTIAMGANVMAAGEAMKAETVEMVASRHPRPEDVEAYERVLGDAMAGDATLFARQDYVEEAWRIVDPVLKGTTPLYDYEKGTWGPSETTRECHPPAAGTTRPPQTRRISASPPNEATTPFSIPGEIPALPCPAPEVHH